MSENQSKSDRDVAQMLVAFADGKFEQARIEREEECRDDGTVRFTCEQKANPHPAQIRVQKPNAEPGP